MDHTLHTAQAESRTASHPSQHHHHGVDAKLLFLRRRTSPRSTTSTSSTSRPSPTTATPRARPRGRPPREPYQAHQPVQASASRRQECGPPPGPSTGVGASAARGLARDPPNAPTLAGTASRAWLCGGAEQRYVFFFSLVRSGRIEVGRGCLLRVLPL